jgi:hypothetical protein
MDIPEYKAPEVNKEYSVGSEITGLLDKGGQYLESARTEGKQYAASRGLLNSSLGAEAAEQARVKAALPIAQQDAQYKQQQMMQGQAGYIQSQHLGLQAGYSSDLSAQEAAQIMEKERYLQQAQNQRLGLQAGYSSQLSAQEAQQELEKLYKQAGYSSKLAKEQAAYEMQQLQKQAGYSSELSAQEAQQALQKLRAQSQLSSKLSAQEATQTMQQERYVQQALNQRLASENEMKAQLAEMEISMREKESVANATTEMGKIFADQVANIQRDPNVTPKNKTAAIRSLQSAYEGNLKSMAGIYGVKIDFSSPVVASGGYSSGGTDGGSSGGSSGGGSVQIGAETLKRLLQQTGRTQGS